MPDDDFYASITKLANEIATEIEADTKGMSAIERKKYFLRIAREHLDVLHALKASRVLIEQAEQHISRLTKELAEMLENAPGAPSVGVLLKHVRD